MSLRLVLNTMILSVFLTVSAASAPISYSEAMRQMLAENGEILAAESAVEQYSYEKRAAFGLHLPTITLDARYTHMNDDLALHMKIPALPITIDHTLQDQNFFRAYASLTWPIFTGFQVSAANNAATAQLDSARADFDATKYAMMHDLTSKYFALELATEAAALRKEVYDGLQQHYDNTKAKEAVGMIPHVESLHAEVSLNEAMRNYNQALQDIEIAKAALKSLITLDQEPETTTGLFVLAPSYMENLSYFQQAVISNSPQINKISATQDLASAGLTAKRAAYMPTVYAFGNYEFYKDDLTMLDPEWYLGLGLQWKVFEGLSGHNQYMAASKMEQMVMHKTTQAKRDLQALTEVYYKQMLKAYEKYKMAKDSLEFAQEYLRVRTKAFESGFATSIDVVDAQTLLSKNRLDIIASAYEFDNALSQLLSLCGEYDKFEEYRNNQNVEIIK